MGRVGRPGWSTDWLTVWQTALLVAVQLAVLNSEPGVQTVHCGRVRQQQWWATS